MLPLTCLLSAALRERGEPRQQSLSRKPAEEGVGGAHIEGGRECHGVLVEFDTTARLFEKPTDQRTEDYISGRFG